MLFRFPADAGSHGVELVFDVLITAIEVVDALDGRGPLGGEPGEHERGAGAEIRGHDRSPGKALDAAYDGCMPGKADIRAHADELLHVHEPVFKNGFADDPGTFGKAHEGHDLRLHVRREAGEGLRGHVHPAQGAGAAGQHPVGGGFDFHAHLAHFGDHGVKLLKGAVREQQLAVGDPGGGEEGSGLDAVGHDAVGAASEARDALNADDAGAVAFDARAAGAEALRNGIDENEILVDIAESARRGRLCAVIDELAVDLVADEIQAVLAGAIEVGMGCTRPPAMRINVK